jgi:beta-lactamase regulating signal transducer with metallopeptidase domain
MSHLRSLIDGGAELALLVAWQMALLTALVWLAERLFLRRAPARHLLWWFVLAAPIIVVPVRAVLAHAHALLAVPVGDGSVLQIATRLPVALITGPALSMGEQPSLLALPALPWRRTVRVVDVLAMLWVAGVLLCALRLWRSHQRVRGLLARSTPVEEAEAQHAFAALCAEAGLRRPVALRRGGPLGVPALYGWRRPTVLLPDYVFSELSKEQVRSLLAHEVAHLRRRDFLANLLQRALETLLCLHPAAWLASWRITLLREELCDAWTLGRGVGAADYARALAAAAEHAQVGPAAALVGLAEERGSLLQRVEMILGGRNAGMMTRRLAVALGVGLVLCAIAFAAVQPRAPRPAPNPGIVATAPPAPPLAKPGEVVEVLPSPPSLNAQETEVALSQLGLQTQRLSYRLPFAHQVEVVIEHYEHARLVNVIHSYSGSGEAGEHTLMLFTQRKGDELTFSASLLDRHGWSSSGTGDVVSLKQYRGSSGSGGMLSDSLRVGVRTPFWYFRADRRSDGAFTNPGSEKDLPKFVADSDLALIAYVTITRSHQ